MSGIFNNDDCCNCVEDMAKQLKKHEGELVIVFEKNVVIFGRIKEVKGNIVILEEVISKTLFFGGGPTPSFGLGDLIVSICVITEFAPLELSQFEAALENFNQSIAE